MNEQDLPATVPNVPGQDVRQGGILGFFKSSEAVTQATDGNLEEERK